MKSTLICLLCLICFASPALAQGKPRPQSLQWRLKKGQSWRYRSINDELKVVEGDVGGRRVARTTKILERTVLAVSKDGVATIRERLESAKYKARLLSGRVIRFDSRKKVSAEDAKVVEVVTLRAMVGESYTFTMNKSGEVLAVQGWDKFVGKIYKGLSAEQQIPIFKKQLTEMYKNDAKRDELSTSLQLLPTKDVSVGQKWSRESNVEIPMLGTLKLDSAMSYKKKHICHGLDCARIVLQSKARLLVQKTGEFADVYDAKSKSASHAVEVDFASQRGMLVKSVERLKLVVQLTAKDNGKRSESQYSSQTTLEWLEPNPVPQKSNAKKKRPAKAVNKAAKKS